jgi:D-alanyl-D-alanine carboxypeptidase (penicillin-binding protein 5/6)
LPLRSKLTLAQTRQRRRLLWLTTAVLLFAIITTGVYFYSAPHGSLTREPSATAGGPTSGGASVRQALHFHIASAIGSLSLHVSSSSQAPAVQAKAAFVYDPVNGWVFYEKNPDQPLPVASLTKIMTLLLATSYGSLDTPQTIGPDAAALVNGNNSYMDLSAGEQVSMRDLLYGLMLPGGNDAALAIADAIAGNAGSFVALMNRNAQELGLSHTSFVSPDGVSDANISSASDMAELAAIAIQQPDIAAIVSTRHIIIGKTSTHKTYTLWSTNDLLPGGLDAYQGVNGLKTGYTSAAGYCMAFTAIQNGHLIVGVILGDPTDQARVSDAQALLTWGFAQE